MFKRKFRLPSPALVISMVTLSLVLGGTAFAASTATHKDAKADTKLIKKLAPSLSVKHAKSATNATNAVNATDATNATNATHASSADSATNATNATNATHATNSDQLGGVAASSYLTRTLASGQTETGVYSAGGGPSSGTGFAIGNIEFVPKLPAAVPVANEIYNTISTHCPGVGQAAAGFLCFYEGWSFSATFVGVADPASAAAPPAAANPLGAALYFDTTNIQSNVRGTWAYTAP